MSFKILIAGDYCPVGRNSDIETDEQFSKLFGGFTNYTSSADFSIVNLECPITFSDTPIKKTGPNIRVSANGINGLKYAKFDLVTLANNHIMDFGSEGLKSTIQYCDENNINYVGAGSSLDDARKPFVSVIKDKRLAILNFAENEFCTTTGNEYGANPLNVISNHYDIQKAKKDADFVMVIVHGGREHYQLPSPKVKERYRFFIDSGADVVIAHHTHCFSGYEMYNGKPIFYSLGNFIFDYKKKYQKGLWTQGYAVQFEVEDDFSNFELIPFHQGRASNPNLVLLNDSEKLEFNRKISEINEIITDDSLLNKHWDLYVKSQILSYKGLLLIQNRYIRALMTKGLIPNITFHSEEHQRILLNLLKCETHREIMIDVLNKKIS